MIFTSCMDIKLFAQVLHAHGTTLDMPTRKSIAPRTLPVHGVVRKLTDSLKPQCKIGRILFIRVCLHFLPNAYLFFGQVLSKQFAIIGKLGYLKINCFGGVISKTFFYQFFY